MGFHLQSIWFQLVRGSSPNWILLKDKLKPHNIMWEASDSFFSTRICYDSMSEPIYL